MRRQITACSVVACCVLACCAFACGPPPGPGPAAENKPFEIRFTLNSWDLSAEARRSLARIASDRTPGRFLVLRGLACDIGGRSEALLVADRRSVAVQSHLVDLGVARTSTLRAEVTMLVGEPREPLRRVDVYAVPSRKQAIELTARLSAQSARLNAAPDREAQQVILRAAPGSLRWWPEYLAYGLGSVIIAAVILLVFLYLRARRSKLRLRQHQFAPGEREALGIGAAIDPRAIVQQQETPSMAAKKKGTPHSPGPSIRGALDREFENSTLKELAKSPVHALAGLTARHARLLEEGFGVKTVEDLSRLKYVEIARAIVVLSEFER